MPRIRGAGVFMSPNQGQVWNQMLGGIGNPLIFDDLIRARTQRQPGQRPDPQRRRGADRAGRAQPDRQCRRGRHLRRLALCGRRHPRRRPRRVFVTKDFGQNWTEVRIPTEPNQGYDDEPGHPHQRRQPAELSASSARPMFPQGNYNISLAVDPTDPNIIYLGGTADGNQTGLIRIDLTNIWDAHSLVAYSDFANDGGTLNLTRPGRPTSTPSPTSDWTRLDVPTRPRT